MENKKLSINCGTCDATEVTEEKLSGFDQVSINCGTVIVSPESQLLMLAHGVSMNTGTVVSMPAGTKVVEKTGSFTIVAEDIPETPTTLVVTGSLTVEPDAGAAVRAYRRIHVIGSLVCPESLAAQIHVTGSETLYPDGYIYLRDTLTMDKLACARYLGKSVYARTIVIPADADCAELKSSGTRLACRRALIAESRLPAGLELIDDRAAVEMIPDDALYLEGSRTLDRALLRRGRRLYIDGGLTVQRRDAGLLEELEYLHVSGRALIPEELEEKLAALDPECGEVFTYRGRLIKGQDRVVVDKPLLGREDFFTILNCEEVELAPELTDGEIVTKLRIVDCDRVICARETGAVRSVCENVSMIGPDREPVEPRPADPNTVKINCGTYKF